jgi:RND family efflux transporter MFP subunit
VRQGTPFGLLKQRVYNDFMNLLKEKLSQISNTISKVKPHVSALYKTYPWSVRITGVLIVIILIAIFRIPENTTDTVRIEPQTIKNTVVVSGQVTSKTDISLSFKESGTISEIPVTVGDRVKKGDVLAVLNQSFAKAKVTTARGALLAAEAKYQKTDRSSKAEVDIAMRKYQKAISDLELGKTKQRLVVENAYRTLLSDSLVAVPDSTDDNTEAPTISGTYMGGIPGTYALHLYASAAHSGMSFKTAGLEDGYSGEVNTENPVPLGSFGLYITFPEDYSSGDVWIITIPNSLSVNYAINYATYTEAVETEKSSILSFETELALAKSELELARAGGEKADTDLAYAEIISARGGLESAQAELENTVIRAPQDGTVTRIDANLGEIIQAYTRAITLQDIERLYVESEVNESDVARLSVGQPVTVSFDALPGSTATATISEIDLSANTEGQVVNYKVLAQLSSTYGVRPGMTATMQIQTFEKENALAIPKAYVEYVDGKAFARKIIGEISNEPKTELVEIITGLSADGGLLEIVQGLSAGDVVLLSKE